MADVTVPQPAKKSKESFTDMVERLNSSFEEEKVFAAKILAREKSNEVAAEQLMMFGLTRIIEGKYRVFVKDAADFYGVSTSYLCNKIQSAEITKRVMPDDYTRCFPQENGNELYTWELFGPDNNSIRLIHKETGDRLEYVNDRLDFISARIMLALCPLMNYGRKIPNDSMVARVYEQLKRTPMYREAKREASERNRAYKQWVQNWKDAVGITSGVYDMLTPEEQEWRGSQFLPFNGKAELERDPAMIGKLPPSNVSSVVELKKQQATEEVARLDTSGNLVMSQEFFAGIIRTVVTELTKASA